MIRTENCKFDRVNYTWGWKGQKQIETYYASLSSCVRTTTDLTPFGSVRAADIIVPSSLTLLKSKNKRIKRIFSFKVRFGVRSWFKANEDYSNRLVLAQKNGTNYINEYQMLIQASAVVISWRVAKTYSPVEKTKNWIGRIWDLYISNTNCQKCQLHVCHNKNGFFLFWKCKQNRFTYHVNSFLECWYHF